MSKSSLSRNTAQWVAGLSWSEIPPEVVEDTKLRVLDILGVMLAGKHTETVARVHRATLQAACGTEASIVGFTEKTALSAAALVNGVMSSVLEFEETHLESATHPSGPVGSAAFAMGCKLGIPGRQLIESMLVGNELSCRLGQVAPGMFHKSGFVPTGVFGVFGAAYAIGRMLALPPAQIADAIGICGSLSAASMAPFADGASSKSLQVGWAAAAAIQAIAFAQSGITGPGAVFEGRFGFFRSHVQASGYDFRFSALEHRLGRDWEALNIVSKAYPTGYVMHPVIYGAIAVKAGSDPDLAQIAEIVCHIADYAVPLVCEPVAEKLRPQSTWHARVSLQHCVAEALVTGSLDKNAFNAGNLSDPRINALADRVRYASVPTADRTRLGGEIELRMRDGSVLRHRVEDMRGTPRNPMSRDEFVAKFRSNCAGVVAQDVIQRTVDDVLSLEELADVTELFARLNAGPMEE